MVQEIQKKLKINPVRELQWIRSLIRFLSTEIASVVPVGLHHSPSAHSHSTDRYALLMRGIIYRDLGISVEGGLPF